MRYAGFLLWLLVCGILVLDIGQAYVHAQTDSSARLRAQEVDIVDSSGSVVAMVSATPDGPEIDVKDPSGNTRLSVGVIKQGGAVVFVDKNSDSVAVLGATDDKDVTGCSLGFVPKNQASTALILDLDGDCTMLINDKAGNNRAQIAYAKKDDTSLFEVSPAKGQGAAIAGNTPNLTHVAIEDPNGNVRSDVGLDSDNAGYFGVADQKGNATWREAFSPDGTASGDVSSGSNAQPSGQSDSSDDSGAVRSPERKRPQ